MTREPGSVSVVLCTSPVEAAEPLVDRLLAARLIACANLVGPVRSRYRWQGAIEDGEEMLLVLKARSEDLPELQDEIRRAHPYDCPEVLAFAADAGLPAYLAWVRDETTRSGRSEDADERSGA
jgi:periplasmic divalent cation tolerance protein